MWPDVLGRRWNQAGPWARLALTVWLLATTIIAARVAVAPPTCQSVYPTFKYAGRSWLHGEGLYWHPEFASRRPVYRYSPLIAALLVPFGLLPEPAGALLWRGLILAVFLGALAWWIRAVLPRRPTSE